MIVTILVPEIKHLPRCTALCLRNFYYKDLGLLAPERYPEPPRAGELYDDLERLCSYEGVRNALLVFHALEIVQKRIHGKQTHYTNLTLSALNVHAGAYIQYDVGLGDDLSKDGSLFPCICAGGKQLFRRQGRI